MNSPNIENLSKINLIGIRYFHLVKYDDLEFDHVQQIEIGLYDLDARQKFIHGIIDDIMSQGYNVQLIQSNNTLIISIDKGYFKQR